MEPAREAPTTAAILLSPLARGALASVAVSFLCVLAWQQRNEIEAALVRADAVLLGGSIALGVIANYLTGYPFQRFLSQHCARVSLATACAMQLSAQLAKYIPGKIWAALLQAQMAGGGAGRFFLAGSDLSVFLMLSLSGLGAGLLLYSTSVPLALTATSLFLVFASALAAQAWLARLTARVLRALGKAHVTGQLASRSSDFLHFLTAAILHSAIYLASMLMLLAATTELDYGALLLATASILLAWVLGTLAIIFPSGLGVREVAFVALADQFGVPVSLDGLAAIAVIVRMALVAQDLVTAVILSPFLITGLSRRQPRGA